MGGGGGAATYVGAGWLASLVSMREQKLVRKGFVFKLGSADWIEASPMSTHSIYLVIIMTKNITKTYLLIFLSMVVSYSSVEMTGNCSQNIQENSTDLKVGTRGKNFSKRQFEIFCLFSSRALTIIVFFFLFFFFVFFFWKKYGNYFQFDVFRIFPESGYGKKQTLFYSYARVKNWSNPKSCKANQIERVHMQFCKRLLGVKKSTQNNFVYEELGRLNYQSQRYLMIIKFWLKVVNLEPHKFVNVRYNVKGY